jgi:glycosyltransferase involved in cell wall biosynthesis
MSSIAIIIPAYNEEESISDVVRSIVSIIAQNNLFAEIIVVNDCSTDGTGEIIESLNCTALHLPVNLGIGGAMQTGFKYAFENNFDFAIQVDGDGQHPADEIVKLYSEIKERNLDVAIGSRFVSKEGFQSSSMRRAGITWFRWLNKFLVGLDIRDSTSGFRVYNRKTLGIITEIYPDEYPEPEAIILFAKNKLNVGEVAVTMKERQGGISSIGLFSSLYYMWKVTLGILFTFIRTSPEGMSSIQTLN